MLLQTKVGLLALEDAPEEAAGSAALSVLPLGDRGRQRHLRAQVPAFSASQMLGAAQELRRLGLEGRTTAGPASSVSRTQLLGLNPAPR